MGFCVASTKNGSGRARDCAADGDLAFLHGFEQRGLGLGRRAVDFVGQHDVGEDRARAGTRTRSRRCRVSCRISVPVMSAGIRSGVNWMRLKLRCKISASVRTMSVLARPGHADEQAMAARKQADQQQPHDLFLADDDLVQLLGDAAMQLADLLG